MTHLYAEHLNALQSQPVPPIQPDDHIAAAIRKVLHAEFVALLQTEIICREDRNAEALRDFRATALHLWALTELIADDIPGKTVKRTRKRLRRLVKRVNSVRELDLMMRDLLIHGEGASDRMVIAGIIAHLDAKRLLMRGDLIKHLDSKKYRKFVKKYAKFLQMPFAEWLDAAADDNAPHQVRHVLPAMLHNQLAAVRAYETDLADADADLLADFYVDTRQLMYLLDGFEGVLGKSAEGYLDAVGDMCEKLERINDVSNTLDRLIHLPRATLDTDQFAALKRYRQRLQGERDRLITAFPDCWADFSRRTVQKDFSNAVLVLLS